MCRQQIPTRKVIASSTVKSMKPTSVKPAITKPVSKSAITRPAAAKSMAKSTAKPAAKPAKPNVPTKRHVQFESEQGEGVDELDMTADSSEDEDNLSLPGYTDFEAIKQYKK